MTLTAGTRLGPYEIHSALGAGGMGEVYKASDTRLDRSVAIKILPEILAADPQFCERFNREARAIAQLTHPHICTLYDVGHQDGVDFLVMEYLEGQTLADRLTNGALPLDQALKIAIQIADALEKAHRQGIVHRDLKPGNVMLTKTGAKLLDFGLAKLRPIRQATPIGGLSAPPTAASPLTGQGTIIGTLRYMAPEQVEGHEADARTDIFALGAVVYEMVTGQKPFSGTTQASLISSILRDDPPPISRIQHMTPAALDRVVRTCLAKDPEERWQSAGDVAKELRWIAEGSAAGIAAPALVMSRRRYRERVAWAVAGLLMAALVLALWRPWSASTPSARPMRLDVRIAETEPMFFDDGDSALAMISPDGQLLLYRGTREGIRRLYVRSLNSGQSRALAGTEGAFAPFFSPDGHWVAFFASGMLNKVALEGGAPVQICPAPNGRGGAWSGDDTIVFTPNIATGLFRVSAAGGTPMQVTKPGDGERTHRWPTFLPGGRAVVFMRQNRDAAYDDGLIETVRLDTGERKILVRGGTFPHYLASGHLAYMHEGTLFVAAMNPDRLELQGEQMPVLFGVMSSAGVGLDAGDGAGQISFSANGTAVYIPGSWSGGNAALEIVDRSGRAMYTYPERHSFRAPRFSPDGTRIAVVIGDMKGQDIYVVDPARATASRVTFDGSGDTGYNDWPVWTPDGKRLAYSSSRGNSYGNIFLTRSDGSGDPERLTSSPENQGPTSFSSDGRLLAGWEGGRGKVHLFVLSMADRQVRPLTARGSVEAVPVFSPDGRWIAYESDESGLREAYVQPYPGPGGKWRISTASGFDPKWTKGGREIVYLEGGGPTASRLMAVDIGVDGDELKPRVPAALFEVPVAGRSQNATWYDASADGTRFVYIKASSDRPSEGLTHVMIALNFFDEVRRATAAKR